MALIEHPADVPREPDRDPVLGRVYAQSARDEPPARLDEAIRAAARREVNARPRSLRAMLRSWRMPVSVAAILVLSASLVMLMKEEAADDWYGGRAPAARTEQYYEPPSPAVPAPAPKGAPESLASAPAAPAAAPTAKTDDRMDQAKDRSRDMQRQVESVLDRAQPSAIPPATSAEERQLAPLPAQDPRGRSLGDVARSRVDTTVGIRGSTVQSAEDAGAQESAKALRAQRASEADAGALMQRRESGSPSQEAVRPPAMAAPAAKAARPELGAAAPASPAPVWTGLERQPPEKWVERIGELRRAGRDTEAREMLEEFRKRFPEYPLPAALTR